MRRGKAFPAYLHGIDIKLRKLRQIVDELADVEEDLRGGLITLPVLYTSSKKPEATRQAVLRYWQGDPRQIAVIWNLLNETGATEWVRLQAAALYEQGMRDLDVRFGSRGGSYKKLFEYKKTKLDVLTNR